MNQSNKLLYEVNHNIKKIYVKQKSDKNENKSTPINLKWVLD